MVHDAATPGAPPTHSAGDDSSDTVGSDRGEPRAGAPTGRPANYPTEWEADVVLRDGSLAHVRPIEPADLDRIREFHAGQSEESVYLRFFAPVKELSERDLHRFTHVDYDTRAAIVATVRGGDIVGIARYDRLDDPSVAEVAFNISDHFQGKGIGSVLLEHLGAIAQEQGVGRFVADVLPQNRKMMNVFIDAGYEVKHRFDDGVIAVEFTIEPTARSLEVQLAREHRAEAQSMRAVLTPSSVAVVGASRRPDAVGSIALDILLDGGFTGDVYLVNSGTDSVRGLKAHTRVDDIEGGVDMAVIAVPADAVPDVIDDCGRAGVKSVVVLSSGFAESGVEGEQRQNDLLRRARANGIRVIGPNSYGVVNTDPDVNLTATIARTLPQTGTLGLFSQSGGIAVGLLAAVAKRRLGISAFASAGNRVDVSGNDLMQFFIEDDRTQAVGLYLESIGNARKFSRIARQLSLRKPVIAVRTGTTGTVPPGHRARAQCVEPEAFEALLAQVGVAQVRNIQELADVAELVTHQPLPAGPRVAVVGNSSGLNAVVAEKARRVGLDVVHGPVTLPTACSGSEVAAAVEAAFIDPEVDSVVLTVTPPMRSAEEDVASAVAHAAWSHRKPCITSFFGLRDVTDVMHRAGRLRSSGGRHIIPVYDTPVDGVAALGHATRYVQWRDSERGEIVRPGGIDREAARVIVDGVLAADPEGRLLGQDESTALLAAYGITLWPVFPVADEEEAVRVAADLDGPIVLRSLLPGVRSGGVRAALTTPEAVSCAYRDMEQQFAYADSPMLAVQRKAPPGVATLIRSVEDPLLGPVVSFGVAGPTADLLRDLSHGFPPLTDVDARGLVRNVASAPLVQGYRGAPAADEEALVDTLLRVAALAEDFPEVARLVLDPVDAHPDGAAVLGAEITLAPGHGRTDPGRRALT